MGDRIGSGGGGVGGGGMDGCVILNLNKSSSTRGSRTLAADT